MANTSPCLLCKHRRLFDVRLSCKLNREEFWEEIQGYHKPENEKPLEVCKRFEAGELNTEEKS